MNPDFIIQIKQIWIILGPKNNLKMNIKQNFLHISIVHKYYNLPFSKDSSETDGLFWGLSPVA